MFSSFFVSFSYVSSDYGKCSLFAQKQRHTYWLTFFLSLPSFNNNRLNFGSASCLIQLMIIYPRDKQSVFVKQRIRIELSSNGKVSESNYMY